MTSRRRSSTTSLSTAATHLAAPAVSLKLSAQLRSLEATTVQCLCAFCLSLRCRSERSARLLTPRHPPHPCCLLGRCSVVPAARRCSTSPSICCLWSAPSSLSTRWSARCVTSCTTVPQLSVCCGLTSSSPAARCPHSPHPRPALAPWSAAFRLSPSSIGRYGACSRRSVLLIPCPSTHRRQRKGRLRSPRAAVLIACSATSANSLSHPTRGSERFFVRVPAVRAVLTAVSHLPRLERDYGTLAAAASAAVL